MKHNYLLGFIFFVFIVVSSFSNFASYDEGIYFGIAKHFRTGGDEGYYEPIRPVGIPLFLMPFFSYTAARVGMLVFVGILLYWLYRIIPDREVSLWIILLLTTASLFIKYSWHLMNDGIAYLFPIFSLYYIKKKPMLSGFLLGAGFLFKFPVIISSLIIIFSLKKLKDIIPFGIGLVIAISPQFITLAIFNSGGFFERLIEPFLIASGFMKTNVWIYGQSTITKLIYWFTKFSVTIAAGILITITWFVHSKLKKKDYRLAKIPYLKSYIAIFLIYTIYFSFFVDRFDERYLLSLIPTGSIIAAISLSKIKNIYWLPLAVLLVSTPLWFDNNPHNLSVDLEGDIFTNTGYAMLYENGKIRLGEGIFIVGDYIDYKTSGYPNYIMSLFEYRCNNDYCKRERKNAINAILQRENITDCGYWHGHQIIVFGENKISAEECSKKINWELSNTTQTSYFIYVDDKDEIYFDFNLFLDNETNFMISENRYWDTPQNSECFNIEWGVYSCRKIFLYPDEYSNGEFLTALKASQVGTVVGVKTNYSRLNHVISVLSEQIPS